MHILVLNGGSSSIKFSIFEAEAGADSVDSAALLDGELSGIGGTDAHLRVKAPSGDKTKDSVTAPNASSIREALEAILKALSTESKITVDAVGYRVVHPGAKLKDHQRITAEVLRDIEEAIPFAPLHNPDAVTMIRAAMEKFPNAAHYACFDTIFHQTMPAEATTYALPHEWRDSGVRRYGFHGLSCEWIVRHMRKVEGGLPKRMIIAHLGSGCSVTAVLDGASIDTTMGFTPTGGVVMGTRPGDLDPGILIYLLRRQAGNIEDAASSLESALNHHSGMVALSGLPNDMRETRKAASSGDEGARLAINVFVRSVTKALGSYAWLMGGVDAIVFTGGIGEHDLSTREEVLASAGDLGIRLDPSANSVATGVTRKITSGSSKIAAFVVPVEEDRMIAIHVTRMSGIPS